METTMHFLSYPAHFFLEWEIFQTEVAENIKCKFCVQWHLFSKIIPCVRQCGIIWYSRAGYRWQYGACALHDGKLRLQIYPQNMQFLLLFHCHNSWTNVLQCNVIYTFPALLNLPQSFVVKYWIKFLVRLSKTTNKSFNLLSQLCGEGGRFTKATPTKTRFSALVQTGPGAHTAPCTMGTGSFPGVRRPGRGVDHPPHIPPRLKKE
jgi:hypothetical protein